MSRLSQTSSDSQSDSASTSGAVRVNRKKYNKSSPEYRLWRDRNNESVRRCREKKKIEKSLKMAMVEELAKKNKELEAILRCKEAELNTLTALYNAQFNNANANNIVQNNLLDLNSTLDWNNFTMNNRGQLNQHGQHQHQFEYI